MSLFLETSLPCRERDVGWPRRQAPTTPLKLKPVQSNPNPCHVHFRPNINIILPSMRRPGRSVGIATDYGLGVLGIESRWGWDFPPVQTGPGTHPAPCTMGTGGVLLTTYPLLVPWSWKSRAILLPTLWATTGPVTGALNLYYHLCTPFPFTFTCWSTLCI